jgi:hypothetical protein
MTVQPDLDKTKALIAQMLAKAESTDSENERDMCTAQAEKLMLKLGIQRAELESVGKQKAEDIIQRSREFPGDLSISFITFTHSVAMGYGDLTTLQSKSSYSSARTAYIIGHESDVLQFLQLLDSLEKQVRAALRTWQRASREERRYQTGQQKYLANRAFIEAFGGTVAARLRAERAEEMTTASTGAALVLADKKGRVDAWVKDTYTLGRAGRGHSNGYNAGARAAGRAAGEKAQLRSSSAINSRAVN